MGSERVTCISEHARGGVMAGLRAAVSRTVLCAMMAWCVAVPAAYAHSGTPPDINFWGPFDAGTAQCQRVVGNAVQRCFERVLGEYRRCMNAQLSGQQCDE